MTDTDPKPLSLETFVPYRMVNLATNISQAFAKTYQQAFDLSIAEWRILALLAEHQALTGKDITALAYMDKSKVSRAVKILQDKQLIHRETHPLDQRAAQLVLSASGQQLYQQIAPMALAWERQLIDVLGAGEYRDLLRIMGKLDARVAQMQTSDNISHL